MVLKELSLYWRQLLCGYSAFREEGELFDVDVQGFVELGGHIFAVLLSLPDALGQEVFDLSVDGTEVVLCPCGDGVIELRRKSERDLFLLSHFVLLSWGGSQICS